MITHVAATQVRTVKIKAKPKPSIQSVDTAGFDKASIPPTTQAQDVRNNIAGVENGYDSRAGFGQANTALVATSPMPLARPGTQKTASAEPILPYALAATGLIGAGMTARDVLSKIKGRNRMHAMLQHPQQIKTSSEWTKAQRILAGTGLLGTGLGAGYALRSLLKRQADNDAKKFMPMPFIYPKSLQPPAEKTAGFSDSIGHAMNMGFPVMQYASGEMSLGEGMGSMLASTAGWHGGGALAAKALSRFKDGKLKGLGMFASKILGSMAADPIGMAIGRKLPIMQRKSPYAVEKTAGAGLAANNLYGAAREYIKKRFPAWWKGTAAGTVVGGVVGNKLYEDAKAQAQDESFAQMYNPNLGY